MTRTTVRLDTTRRGRDGIWARSDPEIESFNLAALDVSALDTRLELTTVLPQYIICDGNCSTNYLCTVDIGPCVCNQYTK